MNFNNKRTRRIVSIVVLIVIIDMVCCHRADIVRMYGMLVMKRIKDKRGT